MLTLCPGYGDDIQDVGDGGHGLVGYEEVHSVLFLDRPSAMTAAHTVCAVSMNLAAGILSALNTGRQPRAWTSFWLCGQQKCLSHTMFYAPQPSTNRRS